MRTGRAPLRSSRARLLPVAVLIGVLPVPVSGQAPQAPSVAVLEVPGGFFGKEILVETQLERILARAEVDGDRRMVLPDRLLLVRNLPEGWDRIIVGEKGWEDPDSAAFLAHDTPAALPAGSAPEEPGGSIWIFLGILAAFAVASWFVATVMRWDNLWAIGPGLILWGAGAWGLLHLDGALVAPRSWLVTGLAVVGFLILLLAGRGALDSSAANLLLLAGLACYGGALALLWFGPPYSAGARWAGPEAVALYVPPPERGAVAFLDGEGGVFLRDELPAEGEFRVLYFGVGEASAVHVEPSGGEVTRLELGEAPER